MNNNLLNVIKQITAKYGDSILSKPKRFSALLADLAWNEPNPQKNALVKCLKHRYVKKLKKVSEPDFEVCKQQLAQELHHKEGFDFALCEETLELLAAVLERGKYSIGPINPAGEIFLKWRLVRKFKGHKRMVRSVAFSPDGKYIVSGSGRGDYDVVYGDVLKDKTLRLWETESGKLVRKFKVNRDVYSVAFSPDGKYIVSGEEEGEDDDGPQIYTMFRLWDAESGALVQSGALVRIFNKKRGIFSPDGKFIAKTGELWEVESGKLVREFKTKGFDHMVPLAFSPDGKYIISVGKYVQLWETESGRLIRSFKKGIFAEVNSVAFSPNGKYIVSGEKSDKKEMEGETLKLWGTESGQLVRVFEGHKSSVHSVAFSPDGNYIVSGSSDKIVKLWEVESGKLVRKLEGHKKNVLSVAFSPDGNYIVSGSKDKSLILWGL